MAPSSKLLLAASLALVTAFSGRAGAEASPPKDAAACHARLQRCPICGGSFEEFKRKSFYVVRQSARLVAWLAS